MSRLSFILVAAFVLSACSSGPAAPDPLPTERVCTEVFCVAIPPGWTGEIADSHIAFNHEAAPEDTFLTASVVNMEAIVVNAGGVWPVTTDEVVRSFWALLDQADVGELTRTQRMVGGAVRSWGSHETGDMWFVLVPIDSVDAIGLEMRAPNDSWESHADTVIPTVEPANP